MFDKCLVVLSGGQDSATCLLWAKEKFKEVHAISFDYGQRHRIELECAKTFASIFGVASHEFVDIKSSMPRSALTDHSLSTSAAHSVTPSLPATFTAARNAVFLTISAGRAHGLGISHLVTGVCQTDYSGYPDCRNEFIGALTAALSIGVGTPIAIHTPLMWLTKAETWRMAESLGGLQQIVEHTHTCYNGNHTDLHPWGYGCGECPACVIRKKGWEQK